VVRSALLGKALDREMRNQTRVMPALPHVRLF
jgi:hypothetical protein